MGEKKLQKYFLQRGNIGDTYSEYLQQTPAGVFPASGHDSIPSFAQSQR